ncbi:hypothetical protein LTR95_008636 [Oleoguttula sp. CCFEE 5521]
MDHIESPDRDQQGLLGPHTNAISNTTIAFGDLRREMLLRPKGRHDAGPFANPVHTVIETTFILSTTYVTVTAPSPTTTIIFLPIVSNISSVASGLPASSALENTELSPTSIRISAKSATSTTTTATSISPGSSAAASTSTEGLVGNGSSSPLETAAPLATEQTKTHDRKAIVGGLSGTIAGLLLIGLLLFFCLRRRRKSRELREISEPISEKSVPPPLSTVVKPGLVRQLSNFALGHLRNRSTPELPRPRRPSPCDGSLIRVPLDHWDRPFAAGGGLRDSITPIPLRVANPDPSRVSTPQPAARPNFLRKQSSNLVAFLHDRTKGAPTAPVADSDLLTPLGPQARHLEPALSREWLVHDTRDGGLPISPSQTTLPVIVQHPPDDPFVDASMLERPTVPHHNTPTLPMTDWTIAHNPFQPQTPQVPWIGLPIYTTYSSSALGVDDTQRSLRSTNSLVHVAPSTTSDQFDLAISPDGSEADVRHRHSAQFFNLPGPVLSTAPSPKYELYEGT